jgi:hypothetical protein
MVSGRSLDAKEAVKLDWSQIRALKRLKFQDFKTKKLSGLWSQDLPWMPRKL